MLERRTSLAETFQTIALLMPPLFSFAAVNCTPEQLEHYEPFRKYIQKGSGDKTRRIPSNLFHDLLRETGSLLLNDLYASLEVYAQVPLCLLYTSCPAAILYRKAHITPYRLLSSIYFINGFQNLLFSSFCLIFRKPDAYVFHNVGAVFEMSQHLSLIHI